MTYRVTLDVYRGSSLKLINEMELSTEAESKLNAMRRAEDVCNVLLDQCGLDTHWAHARAAWPVLDPSPAARVAVVNAA